MLHIFLETTLTSLELFCLFLGAILAKIKVIYAWDFQSFGVQHFFLLFHWHKSVVILFCCDSAELL